MHTIQNTEQSSRTEGTSILTEHLPRILLASLFFVAGVQKIFGFSAVAEWMTSEGVPLATLVLAGTVFVEVGGGLVLGLGFARRPIAWLLAAFTVAATLVFHDFWSAPPDLSSDQLTHFLKNVAIVGGLLLLARNSRSSR